MSNYPEKVKLTCPECQYITPSPPIIEDAINGEYLCTRCGTVVQDIYINTEEEHRRFQDTDTDLTRATEVDNPIFGNMQMQAAMSGDAGKHAGMGREIQKIEKRKEVFVMGSTELSARCAQHLYELYQELRKRNPTFEHKGSSKITKTGSGTFDNEGNEIPYTDDQLEKLLRATDRPNEKTLRAQKLITQMAERMGIQSNAAIDHAAQTIRNVEIVRLLRLRNQLIGDNMALVNLPKPRPSIKDSVLCAAFLLGCRFARMSQSIREVAQKSGLDHKEVGKQFKYLEKFVSTSSRVDMTEQLNSLARRTCATLKLDSIVTKAVLQLIDACIELRLNEGRDPNNVVAGCIYYVTNLTKEPLTIEYLAGLTGISNSTLRNQTRSMNEKHEQLLEKLPADFKKEALRTPSRKWTQYNSQGEEVTGTKSF